MYNLTDLTQNDINVIYQGIGELPAKLSYYTIQKIQAQVAAQPQEVLPEQKAEETTEENKPAVTASAAVGEPAAADIQPTTDTGQENTGGGDGASV